MNEALCESFRNHRSVEPELLGSRVAESGVDP